MTTVHVPSVGLYMWCIVFLSELYTLMKDQDDGVRELKLEQDNRIFNHCFTGTAVQTCAFASF